MRLRNLYVSSMIKGVTNARDHIWNEVCDEFLSDQNVENNTRFIAFRFQGDIYPQRAVELNRKSILYRQLTELDEKYFVEFEAMREFYVDKWEKTLRSFRNLITAVFREATSREELEAALPKAAIGLVMDDVDFVPLERATGISVNRAQELKDQYELAFSIGNFVTMSKLL